MAYTLTTELNLGMIVRQIFDTTSMPGATNPTVQSNRWAKALSLSSTANGATQPEAITKAVIFEQALSAGAATVDLTALTNVIGESETFLGLKVQAIHFLNPVGNAVMTISEGASNGYELMGNAFTFKLLAGQELIFRGFEATPDVASGAKTIDIAGTGTEELQIIIVAG